MRSTISYVVALVLMVATAALMLAFVVPVHADGPVMHVTPGVNGVWFDGPDVPHPANLEAGAAGSVSVSPHISGVASSYVGLSRTYLRYAVGARFTATDATDQNFNLFLGIRYRGGSEPLVQPNEWAPDAGFGWRPFATDPHFHRFLFTGDAGYGLSSQKLLLALGAGWEIPLP